MKNIFNKNKTFVFILALIGCSSTVQLQTTQETAQETAQETTQETTQETVQETVQETTQQTVQETAATETIFEKLLQKEAVNMTIKTDLKTLIRRKAKKEKQVSNISFKDKDGKESNWDIKIRARGNMRNKTCFLPPLKIDFVKADLKNAGLNEAFDDLKLVVHCRNGGSYDDFVIREYLSYKMYNVITDNSFRVQMVNLKLEDTKGNMKPMETVAFLIENDDEMAARLKGRVLETRYGNQASLHPELFDQMCVFQYMIGNTDWYILNKHNVKILKVGDIKYPVAVPYDFDFAGMVGTPYAVVNDKLPFENVKERYYLGPCRPEGSLDATFQLFKAKKAEILALCEFELLNEKSKKGLKNYLEDFFAILENPKSCERNIVKKCDQFIKVD